MKIRLMMFAAARELAGADSLELDLPEGATVAELKEMLLKVYPDAKDLVQRSSIAIDQRYADDTSPLSPTAEIALIPPVSGG